MTKLYIYDGTEWLEIAKNGINGLPGKDAPKPIKGVDYFDGSPGRPGRDGRDGSDVDLDAAEIRNRLSSLKKDNRLSIDAIQGLPSIEDMVSEIKKNKLIDVVDLRNGQQLLYPNKKQIDQRYHGSGVTKIIAGTNVTITSTGSPGGLGDVTINSTGGGGSSKTIVSGNLSGILPGGATLFFGHGTVRSSNVPLYIAQTNETVTVFQMISLTGNGIGHSDVYKVVKNGVATTMTFTVTNASSGTTVTNQVPLVAGDVLSIEVVSSASTTAADILVQLTSTPN